MTSSFFSTRTTTAAAATLFCCSSTATDANNNAYPRATGLSLPYPTSNPPPSPSELNTTLMVALRERRTDQAWHLYSTSSSLPSSTALCRLVSQLAYQQTRLSLTRAQSVLRRLKNQKSLGLLDSNSLGLVAVAAAKSGDILYAFAVVNSILRSGYLPHVKAYSAVLSRLEDATEAIALFDDVCRRYRGLIELGTDELVLTNMKPDCGAFNAVLNACANAGNADEFVRFYNEMSFYGLKPDVLTFNIMIKLCARLEKKHLLVCVLEKMMVEEKIKPCITTFHSLAAAFIGLGDLDSAERLVQAMREGRRDFISLLRDQSQVEEEEEEENCVLRNSLILQSVVSANSSSDLLLTESSYRPDARIYTTLMKGYMQEGRIDDVVLMLKAMKKEEDELSHPDHVTYTTVMTALVKNGSIDEARRLLSEMALAKIPATRVTYNVLLKGYCQLMQMDKAEELVTEMNENDIELDAVSYNILIDGCILKDDSMRALSYFNKMRSQSIAPTKVSYTTLMKAFATAGQPKLVRQVFDEMVKDPRVKVDAVAWNMLIEAYCRQGNFDEGKKIFLKMKEDGHIPTVATYGSLANAIAVARKPGEALILWNEVKERCNGTPPALKPDEGLLGTLADICVRAAFFKKALEIVACMEENGISPDKTRYKRIYIEMHTKMFTSKHASKARQERRKERKRAAEAFKFWLGLPNAYYGSEWRIQPSNEYSDE